MEPRKTSRRGSRLLSGPWGQHRDAEKAWREGPAGVGEQGRGAEGVSGNLGDPAFRGEGAATAKRGDEAKRGGQGVGASW